MQEKIKIAAMAAQVEGLGTIPSIDVLKSELDSAIGNDYTIESVGDKWSLKVGEKEYYIDKNADVKLLNNWDDIAAPEDCFYWASDDPNSEDYGTIVNFKSDLSTYTFLRLPSRTTKMRYNTSSQEFYDQNMQSRSYIKNIKKLELPDTILKLNLFDFAGFDEVQEILIQSNINWEWNFPLNKLKLKKVITENNVTIIGNEAFSGCTALKEVIFSNSLTKIGYEAFSNCTALTELVFPNSLKSIDGDAFYNCKSLKKVILPNSLENLGGFSGCTGLTAIAIPNNVVNIYGDAFYGCTGLTEINIPNSVVNIYGGAFYGCTNLKKIELPTNLKNIGDSAFQGCTSLEKNIVIPKGVSAIRFWSISGL